jgi:hypothetical protein
VLVPSLQKYFQFKRGIKITFFFLLLIFLFLLLFANRFVEPVLRERLHTLIIQGSDSLYYYNLERLNANFFGGNVEVENLHIRVDSNRYFKLLQEDALPSLTMQLDLEKGRIEGLGVFSLIFRKRIKISHILTKEANIRLSRHVHKDATKGSNVLPLWKAIQPTIKSITIDKINLDGVKLLYRNADTAESVKLQFDRCEAVFKNVRIDSTATADTSRIGFAKALSMQLYDLKFRTPDSTYKMKAELISYSSENKTLDIQEFKLQPTLEENFFKYATEQKSSYVIEFKEMKFTNLLLDQYVHNNVIIADSVFITQPQVNIGNDKTLPPSMESKIGKYPHQQLLKADPTIIIRGMKLLNASVTYTEKSEKTSKVAKLVIDNMNALFSNVTNDSALIKQNSECTVSIDAKLFSVSPLQTKFIFHLDSAEGEFDAQGQIRNAHATQLNAIAEPLSNNQIASLTIQSLDFQIHGDNFRADGKVQMKYNDFVMILRKTNEETGDAKTKQFLTKFLNKFAIHSSNPSEGRERVAYNVLYARTSDKGFFGVIWKTIFAGMQNIMLKSGRYQ